MDDTTDEEMRELEELMNRADGDLMAAARDLIDERLATLPPGERRDGWAEGAEFAIEAMAQSQAAIVKDIMGSPTHDA